MNTETLVLFPLERDEYVVRERSATETNEGSGHPGSSTQTANGMLRAGKLIAPLIVAAAFAAPQVQTGFRRLFSAGQPSHSAFIDFHLALDDWTFTEEWASLEQVRALNALLALPAREGFSLDLPE